MKKKNKVAIVCCSNALTDKDKNILEVLKSKLIKLGFIPVLSKHLFKEKCGFSVSGKQRAKILMDFYCDDEIKAIYDISGGDIANEILPYIDFEIIKKNKKIFWGYSDLTTIINAIYTKTGNESVLYQIKNLIYKDHNTFFNDLYSFKYKFIQGNYLQGIVVGGNIRCFLKLAGTEYWPNMINKVLLLEARSGGLEQMITYLSQLKQIGVFKEIKGIILGTFIEMETQYTESIIIDLIKNYVEETLPIVKTTEIGHRINSKAIIIGKTVSLYK